MNEGVIGVVVFLGVLCLVPAVVDLVSKQRGEELSLEKLIVEILQRLSIYLYALIAKLQKIFCVAEYNFGMIRFVFLSFRAGFIWG